MRKHSVENGKIEEITYGKLKDWWIVTCDICKHIAIKKPYQEASIWLSKHIEERHDKHTD